MRVALNNISAYLNKPTGSASLAIFRIVFGCIMTIGVLRFYFNGWIEPQYIDPKIHFPFYGFEWVQVLPPSGMYLVFMLMGISAVGIMLGLFYRFSSILFFLTFTYVELIDQSNYLNHYYFVSLVAFLLIFIPAHVRFSLDIQRNPNLKSMTIPQWAVVSVKLQLAILYFFAGVAKLNYAWLIDANPMRIWLPAHNHLPIIGSLLTATWVAYLFSWVGCLYDLTIPFFLSWRKSRWLAFAAVVIFHLATALFFQIGMFPYIMIGASLIFFSSDFHERLLSRFEVKRVKGAIGRMYSFDGKKMIYPVLIVFFLLQIMLPLRNHFYEGNLFWHEQGYRFSWRVMLMEKAGTAFFKVKDLKSGREEYVCNRTYLTPQQEKMMSTQPDMMLTFAHIIKEDYQKRGFDEIGVFAESYASLNGQGSRPFVDSNVDLSLEKEGFQKKTWVLPYE